VSCALCHTRKQKRFCPALHDRICPQCCGEAREVTIDCPTDCVYLQQAREHEKPREADQLDPAALFPQVEVPRQFVYENEHLLVGLSFALAKAARGNPLDPEEIVRAFVESESARVLATRTGRIVFSTHAEDYPLHLAHRSNSAAASRRFS